MDYIIALVALFLAFRAYQTSKRVESLLNQKGGIDVIQSQSTSETDANTAQQDQVAQAEPVWNPSNQNTDVYSPDKESAIVIFVNWVKEDWLMKLGALLLVIGFGWFATYAILHNWIGPVGRITIGVFVGLIILSMGVWRIRKSVSQGATLLIAGGVIVQLTLFAARFVYGYFTPATVLVSMALIVILLATLSVRYKSASLAYLTLIGALMIPTMAVNPVGFELMTYLLVMSAGVLWVVMIRGWKYLLVLSMLGIFGHMLYLFDFGWSGMDDTAMFIYALLFSLMYFSMGIVRIIRTRIAIPDLLTSVLNASIYVYWVMTIIPEEWQSLALTITALVVATAAFLVYFLLRQHTPFFLHGGIAIVLLGIATAMELKGEVVTIIFALEALALVLFVRSFIHDIVRTKQIAFIFTIPVILSIQSLNHFSRNEFLFSADFFVILLMSVLLFVLGYIFIHDEKEAGVEKSIVPAVPIIIGSTYALILIWLVLHELIISADVAVMTSLFIYTVIGMLLYIRGRLSDRRVFVQAGGFLLGLVILRLFLVEIWDMELTQRIFTFVTIGILLMSTAFIGRRKKKDIITNENDNEN